MAASLPAADAHFCILCSLPHQDAVIGRRSRIIHLTGIRILLRRPIHLVGHIYQKRMPPPPYRLECRMSSPGKKSCRCELECSAERTDKHTPSTLLKPDPDHSHRHTALTCTMLLIHSPYGGLNCGRIAGATPELISWVFSSFGYRPADYTYGIFKRKTNKA